MSPYFKDFLFLTKMTMNLKERVQYLYMNAIHAQFFLCFLNRFPHYHRFHVPLSSIYLRIAFSVPQFQSPETLSLPPLLSLSPPSSPTVACRTCIYQSHWNSCLLVQKRFPYLTYLSFCPLHFIVFIFIVWFFIHSFIVFIQHFC